MVKHTLKAAIDAGATNVGVYCISCPNSKHYTAARALELWGTDATFPDIARRSKCSKCKRQASQAAPGWPPIDGRAGAPSSKPDEWRDVETRNLQRR